MSPRGSPSFASKFVFSKVTISALSLSLSLRSLLFSKSTRRTLYVPDDINIFLGRNVGSAPEKDGKEERETGERGARRVIFFRRVSLTSILYISVGFSAFPVGPQSHFQFILSASFITFFVSPTRLNLTTNRLARIQQIKVCIAAGRAARLGKARTTD